MAQDGCAYAPLNSRTLSEEIDRILGFVLDGLQKWAPPGQQHMHTTHTQSTYVDTGTATHHAKRCALMVVLQVQVSPGQLPGPQGLHIILNSSSEDKQAEQSSTLLHSPHHHNTTLLHGDRVLHTQTW